jgi:hypothetical protein
MPEKAAAADRPTDDPHLDLALRLAKAGLPVLPCKQDGDVRFECMEGKEGASTDPGVIARWWAALRGINVYAGVAHKKGGRKARAHASDPAAWLGQIDDVVAELRKKRKAKAKSEAKPKAEPQPEPDPTYVQTVLGEHHSGERTLTHLLDELASIFRDSAFYADGDHYAPETIALWIASKQLGFWPTANGQYGILTHNPPLLVTAPDPESGKSKVLSQVGVSLFNAIMCTDPSPASLYRTDNPNAAFIIDEADTGMFDRNQMVAVINSSYTRHFAQTARCKVNEETKDIEVESFNYFHPFAFGLIGLGLKRSTLSRCIVIQMRVATLQEVQTLPLRWLNFELEDRLREISQRIAVLAYECFKDAYGVGVGSVAAPEAPAEITSARTYDNWRLQLAIADLAGGHWPETARAAMVEGSQPGRVADSDTLAVLEVAMLWFNRTGRDFIPSDTLLLECENHNVFRPGQRTQDDIGKLLAPLGLRTRRRRVEKSPPRGGYDRFDYHKDGVLHCGVQTVFDSLGGGEEEEKKRRGNGAAHPPNPAHPAQSRNPLADKDTGPHRPRTATPHTPHSKGSVH